MRRAAARLGLAALAVAALGCSAKAPASAPAGGRAAVAAPLSPAVVTERVPHDTDDPAIWVDPADPAKSLILGTDKNADGGLYAFDLAGRVVDKALGLKRPNNVDVEYGLKLGGRSVDIAVVTERLGDSIRVFSVPELAPLDGGGFPVFAGEAQRGPMGMAIYKRPRDGAVFAVVGRKSGPLEGYLWQYRLQDVGSGRLGLTKVRAFGTWSGEGEIEAIAVDDELGYVYYTDEWKGVRKYAADPDAPEANRELAVFGTDLFEQDREGISIYRVADGTGYILVSDQQANQFHVFPREGSGGNPHAHPRLKVVRTSTVESDGSDVTSARLGERFPDGLFVAMSQGGVFHYYAWPRLAAPELVVARDGQPAPQKP